MLLIRQENAYVTSETSPREKVQYPFGLSQASSRGPRVGPGLRAKISILSAIQAARRSPISYGVADAVSRSTRMPRSAMAPFDFASMIAAANIVTFLLSVGAGLTPSSWDETLPKNG